LPERVNLGDKEHTLTANWYVEHSLETT